MQFYFVKQDTDNILVQQAGPTSNLISTLIFFISCNIPILCLIF